MPTLLQFNKKEFRRKLVLVLLFPFLSITILIFIILPLSWVRCFAHFVGIRFYNMAKKSRERALQNLEMIYGKTTTLEQRNEMSKKVFIEVIKSFFDYMATAHIKSKKRFFKIIEVEGEENLTSAFKKGKGVICLIPHVSSWEFAAITPPMLGYETSAASKSMKVGILEQLMVILRGRRGMKNITREGSYQKLLKVLRDGECLILMIDQDTKVKGVFVDFMGHPAYTPLGASRLAIETGASVVPMLMTRKKDQNYRFIIYPELEVSCTENMDADLLENTQRQTKILEKMILKYPTQWVWMHRRWKTTPESLAAHEKWKAENAKTR